MISSSSNKGILANLLTPGWDAAEIVIPILHKCLAALLAVLIYTAQHSDTHVRVHIYVMIILTLGLWGSITWFVNEYRRCLQASPSEGESKENNDSSKGEGTQSTPNTTAPATTTASFSEKPQRYTD